MPRLTPEQYASVLSTVRGIKRDLFSLQRTLEIDPARYSTELDDIYSMTRNCIQLELTFNKTVV